MKASNPLWQPPYVAKPTLAVVLISMAVGTGGEQTPETMQRWFRNPHQPIVSTSVPDVKASVGASTELKIIRNGLRLSVAELARMLGVSRPTIYNWQRGGQLDKDNEIRVREIAGALAPHLDLLATQTGRPAYRAIEGSTTLLDALTRGDTAKSCCEQLIEVLQSEKIQRNRLAQRLSSQTSPRGRTDVDSVG